MFDELFRAMDRAGTVAMGAVATVALFAAIVIVLYW